MIVYGIKNCDTVRKALRFFKTHGIEYTFVDFKSEPVGCDIIDRWLKLAQIDPMFNTRGTTYRTLKLKELDLDAAGKREWLCRNNLLIKRPVIETENRVIIGYDESLYQKEFLS